MISYQEALTVISSKVRPFGTEKISLEETLGRVLAEPVLAKRDAPPFNRSAMDGVAINISDFKDGIRQFRMVETVYAGQESKLALKSGDCYKIMTGAAVPISANAVIQNELIDFKEEIAYLDVDNCVLEQNIAVKGQDYQEGEQILSSGQKINATTLALLASLGKSEVLVFKMPKVAVFTTGNEVVPLSQEVSKVQIYNSNAYLLKALLKENNIIPAHYQHVLDDENLLKRHIKDRLDSDIIIINGGVSAGDADFIPKVLRDLGVKQLFHKVAIKPGKPFWCGLMPNGGMVFALPGNPFSCLVTFTLFVSHYLEACFFRNADERIKKSALASERNKKSKFDEFFPVMMDHKRQKLHISVINGSGDVRLGVNANALAFHPSEKMNLAKDDDVFYIEL